MGAGEGAKIMTAKEKRAEYCKKWREENKEYYKKWWEENKEKKAEYGKKYRDANKEKRAKSIKKWREENKEHVKRYDEANKEKKAKHEIVRSYKRWNGFAPPAEYVEVKYIINKTNNLLKQKTL